MQRQGNWQFSIRTLIVLMLVIGPIAGALFGTFGVAVQEVCLMILGWFLMSGLLAVISMVLACVIVSPLLVLDRVVRRGNRRPASQQPTDFQQKHNVE